MAASPRDENASANSPVSSVNVADLPPLREAPPPRVVSVSPTDAESGRGVREGAGQAERVFLTPRVLDETAFDELAGTMRALLERAGEAAARLATLISEAGRLAEQPAQGATQLQERLRLGARMLKAFQSQIDGAEQSVGRLEEQREKAEARLSEAVEAAMQQVDDRLAQQEAALPDLGEAEQKMHALADSALQRLDARIARRETRLPKADDIERMFRELTHDAIERIEARIAEHERASPTGEAMETKLAELAETAVARLEPRLAERRAAVEDLDQRLAQLQQRADDLGGRLERAEAQHAAAADRLGEQTTAAEAKASEAGEIARQCDHARRRLSEALVEAGERIDGLSSRCDELDAPVRRRLDEADEIEHNLAARVDALATATEKLQPAAELLGRLEAVLPRLAPWEKLLLETEIAADGLPRPVSTMIESLRGGIGRDMAQLSATMRDLAQRVDELGLPAGAEEPSPPQVVTVLRDSPSAASAEVEQPPDPHEHLETG